MATLPTLPQATVDTTYSLPTGTTHVCDTAAEFTTALSNAALGDVIQLQAGTTFAAPSGGFSLPNKTGTGWIYIVSSGVANLPEGTRVTAANAQYMPTITCTTSAGLCIDCATSAHHYRFVGIEMRPVASNFVYGLVDLGGASYIVIDRCYLHGDAAVGTRRGVLFNGTYQAVIDSRLEDFAEDGADSQTIAGWSGAGPFKIVNNYLAGAGENVMFGGAGSGTAGLVPSDIEIKRNHFDKPTKWDPSSGDYDGKSFDVKNHFEIKNGRRILMEGNLFTNMFAPSAQNGYCMMITPRAEGDATAGMARDLTIRYNIIRDCAQGIELAGKDDSQASQNTERVHIHDNLLENIYGQSVGWQGRAFLILGNSVMQDVTIEHNTIDCTDAQYSWMVLASGTVDDIVIRNNISTDVGIGGDGVGTGTVALNAFCTNWVCTYNAMVGESSGSYPSGNFFPTNIAAVGFTNYANGDFALTAQSTYHNAGSDGEDLGADMALIAAAMAADGLLAGPANLRWRPA